MRPNSSGRTACPTASRAGSPEGRQTRRPYHTSDIRYLAQHYPHTTAAACAHALGRTITSLREFIHRHPELRKRGRL